MGAWFFVEPRLRSMGIAVEYVGRDASASPATGSHKVHAREQKELVEAALSVEQALPYQVRATGGGTSTRSTSPSDEQGSPPFRGTIAV